MATKNNGQLKAALASLWGAESVDDLTTQDQEDIQTYINQALFECYAPISGRRPNYGEQYWSDLILAPVTATLGLTSGSKVVTGHTFLAKYAGSLVKIGDRFFRFGGIASGPAYHLVQPWDLDTGSYEATIYHNAVALPGTVLEVIGAPEIVGIGLLAAMPGPETEQFMRTEPAWDFEPRGFRSPFANTRRRFSPANFDDTGDPRYYHIDSASTGPTFAIGNRIHIYPLPSTKMSISLRASYMAATPLEDDEDTPPMPFDSIDNILLPIARSVLVENSAGRRFTGNTGLIMEAAKRARAHLSTLARVQRDTAGGFRTRRGW